MSALATLLTALSSLGANKLRAGLTLLGIVIGVASVISLMAIGKGAQESITSRIESLGTNLLFVRPGATTQGGISSGLGSAGTLTLDDAYALLDPCHKTAQVDVAGRNLAAQVGYPDERAGQCGIVQPCGAEHGPCRGALRPLSDLPAAVFGICLATAGH